MIARVLVFDANSVRAQACAARLASGAYVAVRIVPGPPPAGSWDLVLLHKSQADEFAQYDVEFTACLRYDGGGVKDGIPRPLGPSGINEDEARRILNVLERLPERDWDSQLKAIWTDIPESVLLAALILQVGQHLPEELRDLADAEYRARRNSAPLGTTLPDQLGAGTRLPAFKALIDAGRRWSGR